MTENRPTAAHLLGSFARWYASTGWLNRLFWLPLAIYVLHWMLSSELQFLVPLATVAKFYDRSFSFVLKDFTAKDVVAPDYAACDMGFPNVCVWRTFWKLETCSDKPESKHRCSHDPATKDFPKPPANSTKEGA